MMDKDQHVEFIEEKSKQSKGIRARGMLKDFIDGTVLTRENFLKQLPFLLFLSALAVILVGNRYHAERVLRETIAIQNELKELRAEEITTASELMFYSKQSQVARMIHESGLELEESTVPPKKIKIKKGEFDK
ncbi:MAG: FtsL-like putative cell division protein [Bacteroidota bacterium]